jgi:hypothetical protein
VKMPMMLSAMPNMRPHWMAGNSRLRTLLPCLSRAPGRVAPR